MSSFTVFCCGSTNISSRGRAFCLNILSAFLQMITFIVIVGWIWSIIWGMTFVTLSSEYKDYIFIFWKTFLFLSLKEKLFILILWLILFHEKCLFVCVCVCVFCFILNMSKSMFQISQWCNIFMTPSAVKKYQTILEQLSSFNSWKP